MTSNSLLLLGMFKFVLYFLFNEINIHKMLAVPAQFPVHIKPVWFGAPTATHCLSDVNGYFTKSSHLSTCTLLATKNLAQFCILFLCVFVCARVDLNDLIIYHRESVTIGFCICHIVQVFFLYDVIYSVCYS